MWFSPNELVEVCEPPSEYSPFLCELRRMETTEKYCPHDARPLQGCEEGGLHGEEAQHNLELKMSPVEEKRLLRRIDLWIVPYSSLLFLFSFLDRVNIGQARLAGLEKDLKLHGNQLNLSIRPIIQYDIALTIFFVSYAAFELPSNLVLKKLRPSRWLCFIMVSWAIIQILMGLVKNAKALYVARFLQGMFEAGLFPGLNFLLSTWYTRKELNVRVAVFCMGATLAGEKIVHSEVSWHSELGTWQAFILEGLLTLICALPAPWLVQDFPHYSKLLTPTEKAKWLHRLNVSQGVTNAPLPFTTKQVWKALTDWKTYAYSLIILFAALGFTNAAANALSATPYVLATIVVITVGAISDRLSMRSPFIVIMYGYTILLCDVSPPVKFVAVFITVVGVSPCTATAITFVGNNFGPMYTRAAVMGVFFSFGNFGGIIASNVYPIGDAPRYIRGHAISLGFSCLAIVLSAFMGYYNTQENGRRDRLYGAPNLDGSDCSSVYVDDPVRVKKWGLEGMSKQEIIELGNQHPAFSLSNYYVLMVSGPGEHVEGSSDIGIELEFTGLILRLSRTTARREASTNCETLSYNYTFLNPEVVVIIHSALIPL
ncbi:putative MFS nicotinic acid transporter Tna1 [Hysterangium stoloniferum]|nr:putative MFS nicotinic acid transporter Tna1 [Hysterangium stoloniferum]